MLEWIVGHVDPVVVSVLIGLIARAGVWLAAYSYAHSLKLSARLFRRLAKKSQQIASLNAELRNISTGGDSYAFITREQSAWGSYFSLHHAGEHPVYDARIILRSLSSEDADLLNCHRQEFTAQLITAELSISFIDAGDPANIYVIEIHCRNGAFYQLLQIGSAQDQVCAFKLYRRKGRDLTLLRLYIDPNYPRNAKDEVDWAELALDGQGRLKLTPRVVAPIQLSSAKASEVTSPDQSANELTVNFTLVAND
jgi:hypothetical protein